MTSTLRSPPRSQRPEPISYSNIFQETPKPSVNESALKHTIFEGFGFSALATPKTEWPSGPMGATCNIIFVDMSLRRSRGK